MQKDAGHIYFSLHERYVQMICIWRRTVLKISNMLQAEERRYAIIQRLTDLLCNKEEMVVDQLAENGMYEPFSVGKKIKIDGRNIKIRRKRYSSVELLKVTINTEGSMAIYDREGRKLCGSLSLNLSVKNIELFCVWVRKYNVPVEVVTGTHEKLFQWIILAMAVLAIVLYRAFNILNNGI